jgi:alkylation response protein AidB-like acyl-CoA dehydrogenase
MDFRIAERTQDTLTAMRAIVDAEVVPIERVAARDGHAAAEAAVLQVRAKVKAAGLWGPQIPGELGGMGLGLVEHGLVSEVLGRSPFGHYCFGCQAPDAGNLEVLYKHGTPDQKLRYLAPLAAGEIRSCFSMTEPETAGSNPVLLTCRAEADGDDYVINGRKWFTSAADGASFAIVMAVTAPDAAPHARASQIIVPCDTPGFQLVRNIPIMGRPGGGWLSHGEIEYRDCRVPKANLLGAEGAGFRIAQERLGPGRIHHCMRWIGICERSFDLMCDRALSRDMGGEPLGDKQLVRAWIAESRAKIDAARWLVLEAAWTIEQRGFRAARDKISLIKFYVADVMMEVVDRAIQVHGALGITDDTVLAHFYAHERGARIYDGPDEVHKMVVARRILERHGDDYER